MYCSLYAPLKFRIILGDAPQRINATLSCGFPLVAKEFHGFCKRIRNIFLLLRCCLYFQCFSAFIRQQQPQRRHSYAQQEESYPAQKLRTFSYRYNFI